MSETNNLDFYRIVSVASVAFIISLIIIIILFPIFSGNYFYEIGTIMIYSGELKNIPTGWQICNGENGTPDLTNKFVVGSCNSIPKIERENNDYIGYGIPKKYVIVDKENTDTTGYNGARSDGKIGFMEGNLPYLFGQIGENKLIDNVDFNEDFGIHYDKGTSWYKEYRMKDKNLCELVKGQSYTDATPSDFNYAKKDATNRKGKFIEGGDDLDDLCSGSRNDKYILNDKNLENMQLSYAYSEVGINPENNKFNYYVNLTDRFTNPNKVANSTYDTPKVEHIGSNPNNKRRLFRDYEDYKLYLQLDESCYTCLPMNHKFTLNSYDKNIYLINTLNEIKRNTNNNIIIKTDSLTQPEQNLIKDSRITIICDKFTNGYEHFKVIDVTVSTLDGLQFSNVEVNNKTTLSDNFMTSITNEPIQIIIHTDIQSYLNNTPTNIENNNLIIKNNKILKQRFMNDFVYDVPYNNNPTYYKLIYIIRVK